MATTHDTRTSQTMRALLRLRELIISGEFGHGDRMSELPLVERLGVSRTPVRLALAALEHEGLLRALPSGGYVVREFTRADIVGGVPLLPPRVSISYRLIEHWFDAGADRPLREVQQPTTTWAR